LDVIQQAHNVLAPHVGDRPPAKRWKHQPFQIALPGFGATEPVAFTLEEFSGNARQRALSGALIFPSSPFSCGRVTALTDLEQRVTRDLARPR
jgi:hypothetical protein